MSWRNERLASDPNEAADDGITSRVSGRLAPASAAREGLPPLLAAPLSGAAVMARAAMPRRSSSNTGATKEGILLLRTGALLKVWHAYYVRLDADLTVRAYVDHESSRRGYAPQATVVLSSRLALSSIKTLTMDESTGVGGGTLVYRHVSRMADGDIQAAAEAGA